MPELPEVETVRRGLNQLTLNQVIEGGEVLLSRTVAHPSSIAAFVGGLSGVMIRQWQRRGKYLLAELVKAEASNTIQHSKSKIQYSEPKIRDEPAGWLGVHLRMTGQLLWQPSEVPVQKHCRVRLFFAGGQELRFVDQRTFGQMWWVPPGLPPETVITTLALLGPEPFSEAFSLSYFQTKLGDRHRPIKNALLDQTIVAGVGNIYADESLFLSGIRPTTLCSQLTIEQIDRLRQNIITVLQESIGEGGTTFSDFRDVKGINGNYGNVAWVYDKEGQACRYCQTPIERVKLAGRSAHFCPQCQGEVGSMKIGTTKTQRIQRIQRTQKDIKRGRNCTAETRRTQSGEAGKC